MIIIPDNKIEMPDDRLIGLPAIRHEGWLKLVKHKIAKSGRVRWTEEGHWFPNLILNQGLDRMAENNSWRAACQLGTGSTAPDVTQTGLSNYGVGSTQTFSGNASQSIVAGPPRYASTIYGVRFAAGTATGIWTEIGFGWGVSGNNLWNRALIVDANGVPTSFPVLADEILDAYHECRLYIPTGDSTGTIAVTGSGNHGITLRVARNTTANTPGGTLRGWGHAGNGASALISSDGGGSSDSTRVYTGGIAAESSIPSGTIGINYPTGTPAMSAYTNGNYYRDGSATWGINSGNFAIRSVLLSTMWGVFQVELDPVINKIAGQSLRLDWRLSWGRA